MAVKMPPPSFKVPFLDAKGFLSQPWSAFFRQLFERVGGAEALTNIELADQQQQDLSVIQADITALETEVDTLQTLTSGHTTSIASILAEIEGLKQEPTP